MKAYFKPRVQPAKDQSFHAVRICSKSCPFDWHFHPALELAYTETGYGSRFVGDHLGRYGPHDLVLLGGNLPHTWCSEQAPGPGAHRTVVVQFTPDLFPGPERVEFAPLVDLLHRARRGLLFPARCARALAPDLLRLTRQHGIPGWCLLLRILHCLAHEPGAEPLASEGYVPALAEGPRRRLERAIALIGENIAEDCIHDRVARAIHLTPAAFSRFFRLQARRTFVSYVNEVRIALACRRLVETDETVAEVAFGCGFRNLSNFNRRFRLLKRMNPKSYRARFTTTECRAKKVS